MTGTVSMTNVGAVKGALQEAGITVSHGTPGISQGVFVLFQYGNVVLVIDFDCRQDQKDKTRACLDALEDSGFVTREHDFNCGRYYVFGGNR